MKPVQEEICTRSVSLGSFSEAQHLLVPAFLEQVFEDLAAEASPASLEIPSYGVLPIEQAQ